jgi:hypothetical protein
MLSRSSLETQKLELMSAMSELKLQQASLERENLELRTNHLNLTNNNSLTSSLRRPPIMPLGNRSFSSSTPANSVTSSPMHHHGSQGNVSTNSPIAPKVNDLKRGLEVSFLIDIFYFRHHQPPIANESMYTTTVFHDNHSTPPS